MLLKSDVELNALMQIKLVAGEHSHHGNHRLVLWMLVYKYLTVLQGKRLVIKEHLATVCLFDTVEDVVRFFALLLSAEFTLL